VKKFAARPRNELGSFPANWVRMTGKIKREEAKMIGMTPAMFTFSGR
jgi:hypothetical protein